MIRFLTLLTILGVCQLMSSISCAAPSGRFNSPEGLAFDSCGRLWVANYGSSTVIALGPGSNAVTGVAAEVPNGDLKGPTRLAFDQNNNLFVVNTIGRSLIKYTFNSPSNFCNNSSSSAWTVSATYPAPGTTSNILIRPLGVAIDKSSGDVYVVDNGNNTVHIFNNNLKLPNNAFGAKANLTLDECSAPGAAAFDPATETLYAGCGPTSGQNGINLYVNPEFACANSAGLVCDATIEPQTLHNEAVNTGPTGIALGPLVGQDDLVVSYLYSGNAVDYPSIANAPAIIMSKNAGGCEGVAIGLWEGNGAVFVSNSTLNNITVYSAPPSLPYAATLD